MTNTLLLPSLTNWTASWAAMSSVQGEKGILLLSEECLSVSQGLSCLFFFFFVKGLSANRHIRVFLITQTQNANLVVVVFKKKNVFLSAVVSLISNFCDGWEC